LHKSSYGKRPAPKTAQKRHWTVSR
jgi:hypothetical protein